MSLPTKQSKKKPVNMEQRASSFHFHHQRCTKDNPYPESRAYKIEQEINRKINHSPQRNHQTQTQTHKRTARQPRRQGGRRKAVLSELPTTQQNLSDPNENELRPANSPPLTGSEQSPSDVHITDRTDYHNLRLQRRDM
jgi:hypothetical protein